MFSSIASILLLLMVFIIVVYSFSTTCSNNTITESWVNYQQIPYGNIYTGAGTINTNAKGATPVGFYEYTSYRRPYNYPLCHLVDYPIPHCRTDSL